MAAAITSRMTTWWASLYWEQILQFRMFQHSVIMPTLPQQHIDAPGIAQDTKRVVLLVLSLCPTHRFGCHLMGQCFHAPCRITQGDMTLRSA